MGKYQVAVVQEKALTQKNRAESEDYGQQGTFDKMIRSQVRQAMELLGGRSEERRVGKECRL